MPTLAWLTDPHLNFLDEAALQTFCAELAAVEFDALVITGDIGEAADFEHHLDRLGRAVARPLWFVLGNHDYYNDSIESVRQRARRRADWLPAAGVVELSDTTALVGHGGWGDGRCGDFMASPIMLNDYIRITELVQPDKRALWHELQRLGDDAAATLEPHLLAAAQRYERVFVATHVPPFRQACWHEGSAELNEWTPHFTCRATGNLLFHAAETHPDTFFHVLCGHTHGEGTVTMRDNLRVDTGGAVYGSPSLQPTLKHR